MSEALFVDNISKEFTGRPILQDISFSISKSSVHGFLGPNGAGKSTTMNIIAGLLKPSRGKVLIFGKDVDPNWRGLYIGLLPEHPPLYLNMKVNEYLKFVKEIYSLAKKVNSSFVDYILNRCGLTSVLHRRIGYLSKGFRQRVALAGAIIHNPEIVILDEPTIGLDPKAIIEIRNLIKDLSNDHTIIFSSHLLHEVQGLCDSVTIIDKGKIIASDKIESIKSTYSQKKKIIAKVKKWDNHCKDTLMNLRGIDSIKSRKEEAVIHLEFFCHDRNVQGHEILSEISQLQMEPYEFYEEKLELEDIFQKATSEKN